jgi:hypothetical protein
LPVGFRPRSPGGHVNYELAVENLLGLCVVEVLLPCGDHHGGQSTVSGVCGYGVAPPGRRTVKTEPLPGSLATVTSPPIMRASLREMASPSPVPP